MSQTFERLGHVRQTSDQASACTQAPRVLYRLVICFLSGCTLFMVSFKLMLFLFFFSFLLSLYSFSHGFGTVSVKVFVQCLASLFHVTLVCPSVRNIFDKIEQNHVARLKSPLTVTVKPKSLQTSERHFSFLFFLVVKECV